MLKTAQILRRFAFDEWGGTENSLWNSVFGLRSHNIDSQILSTTAMAPMRRPVSSIHSVFLFFTSSFPFAFLWPAPHSAGPDLVHFSHPLYPFLAE